MLKRSMHIGLASDQSDNNSQTESATQTTKPQIIVSGNLWTSSEHVEHLLHQCLESIPLTQDSLPALEQCIKNERLFSEVHISILTPNSVAINVNDKWPLIAIPIFTTDSTGDRSAGAFLVHSNFLGSGKTLMLGGLWSSRGFFAHLAAQDRALAGTRWRGGVILSRTQTTQEFQIGKKQLEDGFHEQRYALGINLGYEFASHISPVLSVSWNRARYSPFHTFSAPTNVTEIRTTSAIRWSNMNYMFYFDQGVSADIALNTQAWRSDDSAAAPIAAGGLNLGLNPISNHAFQVSVRGIKALHHDRRNLPRLGGAPGARGFESKSLWTKHGALLATDYQLPVWSSTLGTWTFGPFIDAGALSLANNRSLNYHAEGFGTYFYLGRITIPGMGLIVCYNHHERQFVVRFAIGGGGGNGSAGE